MIKKSRIALAALGVALFASMSAAQAATEVLDTFIGGDVWTKSGNVNNGAGSASGYSQQTDGSDTTSTADIVGPTNVFSILSASFDAVGTALHVKINTNYAGQTGTSSTTYGSLFLGKGTLAPGASWTLDDAPGTFTHAVYLPPSAGSSGNTGLYAIDAGLGTYASSGDVILSDANSGYIYRRGQAATINTSTASVVGGATDHSYSVSSGNYIEFVINGFYGTTGLINTLADTTGQMVFGWAMSCANDIIIGTVLVPGSVVPPVPLPAGLVLLLSGLLGIGFLGRYRSRRESNKA